MKYLVLTLVFLFIVFVNEAAGAEENLGTQIDSLEISKKLSDLNESLSKVQSQNDAMHSELQAQIKNLDEAKFSDENKKLINTLRRGIVSSKCSVLDWEWQSIYCQIRAISDEQLNLKCKSYLEKFKSSVPRVNESNLFTDLEKTIFNQRLVKLARLTSTKEKISKRMSLAYPRLETYAKCVLSSCDELNDLPLTLDESTVIKLQELTSWVDKYNNLTQRLIDYHEKV